MSNKIRYFVKDKNKDKKECEIEIVSSSYGISSYALYLLDSKEIIGKLQISDEITKHEEYYT
jgi:hypothetical protein